MTTTRASVKLKAPVMSKIDGDEVDVNERTEKGSLRARSLCCRDLSVGARGRSKATMKRSATKLDLMKTTNVREDEGIVSFWIFKDFFLLFFLIFFRSRVWKGERELGFWDFVAVLVEVRVL